MEIKKYYVYKPKDLFDICYNTKTYFKKDLSIIPLKFRYTFASNLGVVYKYIGLINKNDISKIGHIHKDFELDDIYDICIFETYKEYHKSIQDETFVGGYYSINQDFEID